MRTRHESDCDEHGIFSGRWEIDLTLKEHQKVEASPEFELVLFGLCAVANRSEPPLGRLAPFLTFGYSHIQLLPLSQLHDHAFKPGDLYMEMIA